MFNSNISNVFYALFFNYKLTSSLLDDCSSDIHTIHSIVSILSSSQAVSCLKEKHFISSHIKI